MRLLLGRKRRVGPFERRIPHRVRAGIPPPDGARPLSLPPEDGVKVAARVLARPVGQRVAAPRFVQRVVEQCWRHVVSGEALLSE
jgi:hypothetical protein